MQRMSPPQESRMSGTRFIDSVRNLPQDERERRIFEEVAKGNVPDFVLRQNFRPVSVSAVIDGRQVSATFRVSADYIAVGTNQDYVRMPMSPLLAQRIAAHLGCVLPASRMVDLVDEESKRQGGFQRFYAAPEIASRVTDPDTGRKVGARWNIRKYGAYEGRWMKSAAFAEEQSRMVDDDLHSSARQDGIRSGHKKDIVYHPEAERRRNVAIYHKGIQGLNYVTHENTYADYSHGARLVDPMVSLTITEADGTVRTEQRTVASILGGNIADPSLKEPYNHLYLLFSDVPMDISGIYRGTPPPAPQLRPAPVPSRAPQPAQRRQKVVIGEINQ